MLANLKIAILSHDERYKTATINLAKQLKLPVVSEKTDYDFLLVYTSQGLGLCTMTLAFKKPFYVDFSTKRLQYRVTNLRQERLLKATALLKKSQQRVLDATAGLGRDAYLMAQTGADVIMLERNPIIYVLLQDAMKRLKMNTSLKLRLQQHEAKSFILNHADDFDVIYLDPMYVSEHKSALVKKEMQILQTLIGPDLDYVDLLTVALKQKQKRIVIKRAIHSEPILTPSYSYSAKDTRFDVYQTL